MKKSASERECLLSIIDYYDEIIEEMSKSELEESIKLSGNEPKNFSKRFKNCALEAIKKSKRHRLQVARSSYEESRNASPDQPSSLLKRSEKITALERVIRENPNLKTMAARGLSGSFSDMPDEELDGLLRQMKELNLWDEDA